MESTAIEMTHQTAESRAVRTIREIFASGRPLTYIRSAEEHRVARVLHGLDLPVSTWSLTEGLRSDADESVPGTEDPRRALDFIIGHESAGIFHLKDFHEPLRGSPEIRRRLRDVYDACLDRRKFAVISSPVRYIPEELERSMVFLELRPPDMLELAGFLSEEAGRIAPGSQPDPGVIEQLA